MTVADLDRSDSNPILVQTALGLSDAPENWSTVTEAICRRLRLLAAPAFGSAEVELHWGQLRDPNRDRSDLDLPRPALDVDSLVRLVLAEVDENGRVTTGTTLWHGFVESVDESDPTIASLKVTDLGALLARCYLTRGWEVNGGGTTLVEPGFLPAFNAIPGGDRLATIWMGSHYVHDRRGGGSPWTAFQIADLLLIRGMRPDLPGAHAGATAIKWRMDPASAGDYTPDTQDFDGKTVAAALDELFSAKRGLAWRITVSGEYAQVLVIDLDNPGANLDTTDDLGWTEPKIQRRRDGYDYVLVSGSRPLVGITLAYTIGASDNALEPDGWTPGATADAALDAALLASLDGAAYTAPEWRRFKIRPAWNGQQYNTPGVGLRNDLVDGDSVTPMDGSRNYEPPVPPPNSLEIERQLPCSAAFGADPLGPRQTPVVVAGKAGTWQDLSDVCKPTPVGGNNNDRSDQTPTVLLLGDTAEDADRLREAMGADGTLLLTIGVREWAPLQCAWQAGEDARSKISPRVYRLKRPGTEEWLCLEGCVKGVDSSGNLSVLKAQLDVRSDIPKLQELRDQLRVRFGATITGVTIKRQGAILIDDWLPGDRLFWLTLADGRRYAIGQPCTTVEFDFDEWSTFIRWSPILDERPKA